MAIDLFRNWKKLLLILVSIPLVLFLSVYIWLISISPGTTDQFTDSNGKVVEGSVAEAVDLEIGGVNQFVLIRGKSKDSPILLVLHGGPGDAEQHMFREYNSKLEDSYIVVHWDQRGCGRSFSKDLDLETLTLDQMISDAYELTQYLKKKFNKDKVFLMGHSWGAFLGMNIVHKYPEDYYAMISIGQVADQVKSESLSYEFVLNKAKEDKNEKAIKELTEIGPPKNGVYGDEMLDIIVQRQWAMEFGGTVFGKTKLQAFGLLLKPLLFYKEYRLKDKLNWPKGAGLIGPKLFPITLEKPLIEDIKEIKVPYYLFQGKNDVNTFYSVAKDFFNEFKAPKKEMFSFEKSSHFLPFNVESEKFNEILTTKIINDTAFVVDSLIAFK